MIKTSTLHIFNILLGLLLMWYPLSSLGRDPDSLDIKVIKIDMRNGLPESRIRAICPLQDGRIAIATAGYLSIFDGISFTTQPIVCNNGIPLSVVRKNRQLFQDKNNVIWLKTPVTEQQDQVKLLAFDAKTGYDITTDYKKIIGNKVIKDFYVDNQGNPFFIDHSNNLCKLYRNTFQSVFNLTSISKDLPACLLTVGTETFLCYESGLVGIVDLKEGLVKHIENPDLPYENLRLINANVKYRNGKIWMPFHKNNDKAHSWFASLDIKTRKWDHVHIPTLAYDFTIGTNNSIIVKYPYVDDSIFCIETTPHGEIWIGTQNSGLYYYNENANSVLNCPDSVFPLKEGELFVDVRSRELAEKYAPGVVNASAVDTATNYVYLATREGLYIIDENDNLLTVLDSNIGIPHINVQSVVANVKNASQSEHNASDVWFTSSSTISRLRFLSSDSLEIIHLGLLDGIDLNGKEFSTRSIGMDSARMLIAGYPNGYFTIDPLHIDESTHTRHIISLKNNSIIDNTGSFLKWLFLIIPIIALIALCMYLLRKRRKNNTYDHSSAPLTRDNNHPVNIDSSYSNSRIDKLSDNLVNQIKETVLIEKEDLPSEAIEFQEKLNTVINEHIADQSLNVVQLSGMMAMDRTNLYRKMQSLLGTSPSAYIKDARLSTAARLLKETDIPIADIAVKTGFSSTKYFSSTFKEKYGELPAKYRSS